MVVIFDILFSLIYESFPKYLNAFTQENMMELCQFHYKYIVFHLGLDNSFIFKKKRLVMYYSSSVSSEEIAYQFACNTEKVIEIVCNQKLQFPN